MNSSFAVMSSSEVSTVAQKEAMASSSAMAEKQNSAGRVLSLHTRLQQEAEKIRRWKTQTEVEIKQKDRKLVEANQTMATLRKSILELQLQNESMGQRLEEEISRKDDLVQRIESTREMCNLLKNFAANVGDRISQCEMEKEEMIKVTNERCKQFEDLSARFHSLQIKTVEEREQMKGQLSKEQTDHSEHINQLTATQSELEKLVNECGEKESAIEQLKRQLGDNYNKLNTLQDEYSGVVNKMEKSLENAKDEVETIGASLKEALNRESVLSTRLEQLESHIQQQTAQIEVQLQGIETLSADKTQLEAQLEHSNNTVTQLAMEKTSVKSDLHSCQAELEKICLELETLSDRSKMLSEEKCELSKQVMELEETKSLLDKQKSALEDGWKNDNESNEKKICELVNDGEAKDLRIGQLSVELENTNQQRLDVVDKLAEMNIEKDIVESDLKATRNELGKMKKEFEKLTVKHQNLDVSSKEEIRGLYEQIDKEQSERVKLREELTQQLVETQADTQKLVADLSKRDQQLQLCQDQLTGYQQKHQYLLDQVDKLTYDKNSLDADLRCCSSQLEDSKQNFNELAEKLAQVESTAAQNVSDLTQQLKDEQTTRNESENNYKRRLNSAVIEADKLKAQVESLRQSKEAAEKQIKVMSCQLTGSLEQYKHGFDEILERNKQEFEDNKKRLVERLEILTKQNVELKDQLEQTKCDKEASDLKAIAQSVHLNSLVDNSRWELDSAVAHKDKELEELRRNVSRLEETVKSLDSDAAKLRAASFAELERCRAAYEEKLARKVKETDDLRRQMLAYRDRSERAFSTPAVVQTPAIAQTPVVSYERKSNYSKSVERPTGSTVSSTPKPTNVNFTPLTSRDSTVAREPMSVARDSVERSKVGIGRGAHVDEPTGQEKPQDAVTPKRGILRLAVSSAGAKKHKGIMFAATDFTEESSSDVVVVIPPNTTMSAPPPQLTSTGRTTFNKRDGKIFFKASPRQKSSRGSAAGGRGRGGKQATREQSPSTAWFDNNDNDVFGFSAED